MSELDILIPPEIAGDEFYHIIKKIASEMPLQHILEIGSSSGGGSTQAFIEGINLNPIKGNLYCLEVSLPRFEALVESVKDYPFVKCLRASSVPLEQFPTKEDVLAFYDSTPSNLNKFPKEEVLRWLQQDIDYIKDSNAPGNGIEQIKKDFSIAQFDLVLIDGSEFLGVAEMQQLYGAGWFLLDDINGYKNFHNHQKLTNDPSYELLYANQELRAGFSIFRRIS